VKATEWSERSRLRTQELLGIQKAIEVLSNPEAVATFKNASTTFLQLDKRSHSGAVREHVYSRLMTLARKFHSASLASAATKLKAGGHFDKVIAAIDQMIAQLRKEEQADIEHRDRCQGAQNKNANDKEDDLHAVDKTGSEITRLTDESKVLSAKIESLKAELEKSKVDREELLNMRNKERAEFKQSLKDDADAIKLLETAVIWLTKFYRENKIPLSLLRVGQDPEFTIDHDKAPETIWDGPKYGGRKEETHGLVAIIAMIKEDFEKEMSDSRKDDAEAEKAYEKQRTALKAAEDAQMTSLIATEKELTDLNAEITALEEHRDQKQADLEANTKLGLSIYSDCSWVETHFESRRTKRKAEIDGLVNAKGYLAGVESGTEIAP